MKDHVVSSGNVFKDLGLPNAEELQIKGLLALQVGEILARRGLRQAEAAALLGVDQPKVSALVRGHLEKFSVERLCAFLTRLGCDVDIRINAAAARPPALGKLRVKLTGRRPITTRASSNRS